MAFLLYSNSPRRSLLAHLGSVFFNHPLSLEARRHGAGRELGMRIVAAPSTLRASVCSLTCPKGTQFCHPCGASSADLTDHLRAVALRPATAGSGWLKIASPSAADLRHVRDNSLHHQNLIIQRYVEGYAAKGRWLGLPRRRGGFTVICVKLARNA